MTKHTSFSMSHTSRRRGFTIIETLVSLSIFTLSILGLIVITSAGVADGNYAKNKLVASYLAQEGIEMVHNLRDSSSLSGATWQDTFGATAATGLSGCYGQSQTSGCDIDPYTLAVTPCSTSAHGACSTLRYDQATGSFRSNAADQSLPETPFSRFIFLTDVSPNEVEVISSVSWLQGGTQRSVSVNETLANWVTITPSNPNSTQ